MKKLGCLVEELRQFINTMTELNSMMHETISTLAVNKGVVDSQQVAAEALIHYQQIINKHKIRKG